MHAGLHCTPEWATVHTHQQCTLHEGGVVQVRWGTTDSSLLSVLHHRVVSRTSSGRRGRTLCGVFVCSRSAGQVPTPPHCHTAPVPQPPQQVLSAALSMFECEGHSVVCVCVFQGREVLFSVRGGWEVRVCSPGWSEVRRVEVTVEQSV